MECNRLESDGLHVFLFSHRLVRVVWCAVGILILSIKTSWQGELQISSRAVAMEQHILRMEYVSTTVFDESLRMASTSILSVALRFFYVLIKFLFTCNRVGIGMIYDRINQINSADLESASLGGN